MKDDGKRGKNVGGEVKKMGEWRHWRTVKGRLRRLWGVTNKSASVRSDDPEMLLSRAQSEMQTVHAKNRQRAVEVITHKNHLQQMVTDLQATIESLRGRANAAELRGEPVAAAKIRDEIASYEVCLIRTRSEYEQAEETVSQVKAVIKREEARIRQKTAEALVLQAQWRTLELERSLAHLMTQITVGQESSLSAQQIAVRHRRNRASMVQAIIAKNNLLQIVNSSVQSVEKLRQKAESATKHGDEEQERYCLREMEMYEANLATAQEALHRAEALSERAKALVHQESAWMEQQGIPFPEPDMTVAEEGDGVELLRQEREERRGQLACGRGIRTYGAAHRALCDFIVKFFDFPANSVGFLL